MRASVDPPALRSSHGHSRSHHPAMPGDMDQKMNEIAAKIEECLLTCNELLLDTPLNNDGTVRDRIAGHVLSSARSDSRSRSGSSSRASSLSSLSTSSISSAGNAAPTPVIDPYANQTYYTHSSASATSVISSDDDSNHAIIDLDGSGASDTECSSGTFEFFDMHMPGSVAASAARAPHPPPPSAKSSSKKSSKRRSRHHRTRGVMTPEHSSSRYVYKESLPRNVWSKVDQSAASSMSRNESERLCRI